ncbi:MAG: hypothetical protein ABI551_23825 [Polyangiaceae bacterium]
MKRSTVGLALVLCACGGKVAGGSGSSGGGGHSVVASGLRSNADTADPFDADVVVRLTGALDIAGVPCTGILLSRTAVLTSSRCVVGSDGVSVLPPVDVGSPSFASTHGMLLGAAPPAYSELGHAFDFQSDADLGADLAIVFLDSAPLDRALNARGLASSGDVDPGYISGSVDSSSWGSLLGIHVVRPSLVAPGGSSFAYASWAGEERELISFHGSLAVGRDWSTIATVAVTSLDSGSPLFSTRPDGSRDPFGVLGGGDGEEQAFFVDITSPRNSGWIRDRMVDRTHDGKPHWKAMHPPPTGQDGWWLGEDEYSGPCQITVDADCDHWTDAHDDCPDVFDHEQADANDDGQGDACSGK